MKTNFKKILLISIPSIILIALLSLAGILYFRIDATDAKNIALNHTNGGTVLSESIENEGLWSEYYYVISSGDKVYKIEIGGFGRIREIRTSNNIYPNT